MAQRSNAYDGTHSRPLQPVFFFDFFFTSHTAMDLRISNPISSLASAGQVQRPVAALVEGAQDRGGFSSAMKDALRSVSAAQNHSAGLQQQVQMENPAVSLEETMVAMQKAQIGFQATLHVRNRMVQAYTDIMNMQV